VTNEKIKAGQVIVGLAASGKATYEEKYNSGIASNGLTSARHDVLKKIYGSDFPESYDTSLDDSVVYIGPHRLTDSIPDRFRGAGEIDADATVGDLVLSPTRTFAPVMKTIFENYFDSIFGLIHCSGGGQTKCMKYVPDDVRIVKDNLFETPPVFRIIQEASGANDREMYQVFNMGTRLEIYTNEKDADNIVSVAKRFGVDARIIGHVEKAEDRELRLHTPSGVLIYK
jgi:phosphoribosylformylglycinamidine cyclo-ligase